MSTAPVAKHAKAARGSAFPVLPVILVALATAVRIAIACATPVVVDFADGNAYDDELFVRIGLSIASGNWLGAYGEVTMAKNPGYPLFLAFCGVTHIPYQLALIMLIALGAGLSAMAIRPLVKNRCALIGVYLVLLFNPLSFTTAFFRRIYRDGLVIPFAMMALAGYIGLYLRRKEGVRRCLAWGVAAGVATACLQVIKENGMWVMPFAVVCCAVVLGGWAFSVARGEISPKSLVSRVLVLLLVPALVTPAFKGLIKAKNQEVYGVSTMSDRFDGAFSKVCSKLSLIDGGTDRTAIWVSRNALSMAFEASPTLAQIQSEIWAEWDIWSTLFDYDEVYGDLCYWALMDASNDAGKCESATASADFWGSVSFELEEALDSGRLPSRSGVRISSVAPPIEPSQLCSWILRTARTSARLATLDIAESRLISDYAGVSQRPDALSEEGQAVTDLLGGNVIFTTGTEETSPDPVLANTIDGMFGHVSIAVSRLALLLLLPCLIFALVSGTLHSRPGGRLEIGLIVSGLCLTSFAYEAAITWYVQYQLAVESFGYESYIVEAYKYSPEFVVVLLMAALYSCTVVLGNLERRAGAHLARA